MGLVAGGLVECVADPIHELLLCGGMLPSCPLPFAGADGDDLVRDDAFDAGLPSGPFSSSASRHLHWYRKDTRKSLISQTISIDNRYDFVYVINVKTQWRKVTTIAAGGFVVGYAISSLVVYRHECQKPERETIYAHSDDRAVVLRETQEGVLLWLHHDTTDQYLKVRFTIPDMGKDDPISRDKQAIHQGTVFICRDDDKLSTELIENDSFDKKR